MTIVRDLAASVVTIIIITTIQYFAIMALSPGTTMYEFASSATHVGGDQHAEFYYKVLVLWGPLILDAVAVAFPFVRAYRTDKSTGVY